MAYSYDYATRTILVPQADLLQIEGNLFELDTNVFRLLVVAEQASERGMWAPTAIVHNGEVTVAGTTFARLFSIVNGWSVEFENGNYSVRLVGSNNNMFDVENNILVQNQVQVISTNSAGLVNASLTLQQIRDAMQLETTDGEASVDTKLNNNFAVSAAAL